MVNGAGWAMAPLGLVVSAFRGGILVFACRMQAGGWFLLQVTDRLPSSTIASHYVSNTEINKNPASSGWVLSAWHQPISC